MSRQRKPRTGNAALDRLIEASPPGAIKPRGMTRKELIEASEEALAAGWLALEQAGEASAEAFVHVKALEQHMEAAKARGPRTFDAAVKVAAEMSDQLARERETLRLAIVWELGKRLQTKWPNEPPVLIAEIASEALEAIKTVQMALDDGLLAAEVKGAVGPASGAEGEGHKYPTATDGPDAIHAPTTDPIELAIRRVKQMLWEARNDVFRDQDMFAKAMAEPVVKAAFASADVRAIATLINEILGWIRARPYGADGQPPADGEKPEGEKG